MRYRTVLVAGVVFLVTGIVAATVGAIALVLNKSAQQQVVDEIGRSRQIFEDLQSYRRSLFRSQALVVADEPRLKAVVATTEISADTVLGVARELRQVLASDLLLITDSGAELRADTSESSAAGQSLAADPLLTRALAEGQADGIWIHQQRVYQMQAQRLSFGPTVVGALVIGFEMDSRVAETVYRQTGSAVLLQLEGRLIAGSALANLTVAGGDSSTAILSVVKTGDREPAEVDIAGTRYLAVASPVPGYTGKASLRYVVLRSLDEALAPGRMLLRVILGIAAVSLLMAVFLAIAFASRLSRPIDDLVAHTRLVAAGDLRTQVRVAGPLELQTLAAAMNGMVAELRALKEGLERRVEERTRELTRRGRDMRLVLDNVAQGFLTIDARGRLAKERSAAVDRWFGGYSGEVTFSDYAARIDRNFGQLFGLGYDMLKEGSLPTDLCLDQLPQRLHAGGREFRCQYIPIDGRSEEAAGRPDDVGEAGGGLLIVISDVTDQLANAHKEAEQREALALFLGLMTDRSGYLDFLEEAGAMMERLNVRDVDLLTVKSLLHTLKGNAGVANLDVLAGLCDRAEGEVNEAGAVVRDGSMAALRQHWSTLDQTMRTLLGQRESNLIELDGSEIDRLCDEVAAGVPAQVMIERLHFLRLEPAERPLLRLAKHAVELGKRLGKGDVAVRVDAHGVRIDARRWAPLWTDLVHMVRNAVDHGLETPEERRGSGKPPRPRVWFEANVSAETFVITVGDDGRGIDWQDIRRLALLRGLPVESQYDLSRALFSPELTTRREVTAISGRGIGLAAVLERVVQLGGTIAVESQLGRGSSWTLSFPLSVGDAETVMSAVRRPRAAGAPLSLVRG